tara:strand:+ start:268 stop:1194 length:927 start_codon:yes stop_codon:yes gene_type:complete
MKTVVILLSDKRSGSTMFQDALCAHPKVQTVEYSPHTYLETHHWLKAAVLLGVNPSLFSNGKTYKNYGSRKNARIYLEAELKGNLPNYSIPKDDKQLVFDGWEALCDRFAQPIFFEKSPQHLAHWAAMSLLLEWAQQTKKFKVKIIGLVRNPLSVQYSAFKLFRTLPQKRQFDWLHIHKNLLALESLLEKEQFYFVKYEEIVDVPEKTLTALCNFIGIDYDQIMTSKIHGNSKTKWNDDPYFTLTLDPAVTQMAKSYGYVDNVLKNNNTNLPNKWSLLVWNIDTMILKLKNEIINRLIRPIVLKFKFK